MSSDSRDLSYVSQPVRLRAITSCPWCGSRDLRALATRGDGLPVRRCGECALGFLAETPDDLSVFYDDDYFARRPYPDRKPAESGYENYARSYGPSSFRWMSALLRLSAGPGRQRLFDLGAATGTFLEIARYEGFDVHGSELIAQGAAAARAKGLDVVAGAFDPSAWPSGSFDVVTALDMLEHLGDLRSTLADLHGLLSDDGLLAFFVPIITDDIVAHYGDAALDFNKSYDHTLYFNPASLERIFEDSFGAGSLTLFTAEADEWGQSVSAALGFVRKNGSTGLPERRVFDVLNGTTDLDHVNDRTEASTIALVAAKFSKPDLADAALARAEELDAPEHSLASIRAQVLRNRGELFNAIEALEEVQSQNLAEGDPLLASVLIEIVEDFLALVESDDGGVSAGMRQLHAHIDREAALETERDQAKRLAQTLEEMLEAEQDRAAMLQKTLAARDKAIANTGRELAASRDGVTRLQQQLNAIYRSRAWKAISRFREVKQLLRLPPSTSQPAGHVEAARRGDAAVPTAPASISLIMPVFNKGSTLLASVDSILGQTLPSVDVVVWDDGSTDPLTLNLLSEIEELDHVQVFRAPNRGVVHARNAAIAASEGDFLACLDPDDVLETTYLEKAAAVLRSQPEVAIVYPWVRTVGGKEEIWKTHDLDPTLIAEVNHVPVGAVFRRAVFDETGGFSPEMKDGFEDWEFWAHAAELGFRGRVIPEPLFQYAWSADPGESRDATARRRHGELAARIRKLHPKLSSASPRQDRQEAPRHLTFEAPRFPQGSGRPIVLALPWFTVGGADRMVESLLNHWAAIDRTVVAITTLDPGDAMRDRMDDLLDLTPYAYALPSILPEHLWLDFLDGILEALPQATIVNVGSAWLRDSSPAIKKSRPDIRIIDQQFNAIGHVKGSVRAGMAIDVTVIAYEGLRPVFAGDGRLPRTIETVYVGIEQPEPVEPEDIKALRSQLGMREDERYVTFIGRLSEEKRPEWLLPLADALSTYGASLVVVGSGPMSQQLAPEFARRRNVVWLQEIPSVAPLYADTDVVVLPSRTEGIPLTVMESLASGTAVVATAVGGLPELDGTPGLTLTPETDQLVWISAIIDALERDHGTIALSERFGAKAMVDRFDELIDERPR